MKKDKQQLLEKSYQSAMKNNLLPEKSYKEDENQVLDNNTTKWNSFGIANSRGISKPALRQYKH